MANSGNNHNQTELRKKPRRQFHYLAKIVTGETEPQLNCTISDVSTSGARLVLENDDKLPDCFTLLLSRNGGARRQCRIIWRTGLTVGVEFAAG